MIFKFAIYFLIIIIISVSCTAEKRVYRNGYFVQNSIIEDNNVKLILNGKTKTFGNVFSNTIYSKDSLNTPNIVSVNNYFKLNDENLYATNSSNCEENKNIIVFNTDSCDNIILKNGDEINAIVIEVGISEIRYKKCDNKSGPTYAVFKSDVFLIKYSNGTKDIFTSIENKENKVEQTKIEPDNYNVDNRKSEGLGIAGFVISLVDCFLPYPYSLVLGAIAFIFGVVSISRINNYPKKYFGKGFGIISILLGLVCIIYALYSIGLA